MSAIAGMQAAIAYWATESFFITVLPRLQTRSELYNPPPVGLTALLLILYSIGGCLVGIAAGLAIRTLGRSLNPDRAAVALRAVVTFLLSLAILSSVLPHLPRGLPLWYALLAFGIICLALLSQAWMPSLRYVANPWTASLILIGLPSLVDALHPASLLAGPLLYTPALFAVWFILAAIGAWIPARWQTAASLTVAPCLLLGPGLLLRQQPRVRPHIATTSPNREAPNIILITMDTVRADHLSLYRYDRDTTPNLRRLAQEATVYTNAISPGDMTLSSHASIFTGLFASSHGAHYAPGYEGGRPLDARFPTLAGRLAEQGYDTVGVIANYPYLGDEFGLNRGFTYYDQRAPVIFLGPIKPFLLRERVRNFLLRFSKPNAYDVMFRRAADINDAALDVLKRDQAAGKKFFCFLNYMDAHWPYLPPDPFSSLYPGFSARVHARHQEISTAVLTMKRPLSEREREHFLSQYDGGIAYMDWAIGEFTRELKQQGLYDNTLLIVTSDHGEAFGEKSLLGHGVSVYQNEVHVPLLIKYPHDTGKVVDEPVSLVDLMPTVLETAGYPAVAGGQGLSLLRPRDSPRDLISESFVHPAMSTWHPRFRRTQQAIFSGSLKFIHSSNAPEELYNLATDPQEEHNLWQDSSPSPLEARLTQFLHVADFQSKTWDKHKTDRQTLDKLRSLGYIQ